MDARNNNFQPPLQFGPPGTTTTYIIINNSPPVVGGNSGLPPLNGSFSSSNISSPNISYGSSPDNYPTPMFRVLSATTVEQPLIEQRSSVEDRPLAIAYQQNTPPDNKSPFHDSDLKDERLAAAATTHTGRALIRFQYSQSIHSYPVPSMANLKVGDMVIVEGDRGEDCGRVVLILQADPSRAARLHRIHRQASASDIRRYEDYILPRTQEVVQFATAQAAALQLNIRVAAADVQFDERKITLHYYSQSRINFSQLLYTMHDRYKCRVWLNHIDRQKQPDNASQATEFLS